MPCAPMYSGWASYYLILLATMTARSTVDAPAGFVMGAIVGRKRKTGSHRVSPHSCA